MTLDLASWLILLLSGLVSVLFLINYKYLRPWPWQLWSKKKRDHPAQGSRFEKNQNHARPALEILYPGPTNGTNEGAEVDIIAVHGLGSDVDWAWTYKDGDKLINWLQQSDMLPAKVPRSRIIVYNYESKWHADAPKTRLELCGEELVRSIHDWEFRKNNKDRPIIFIGHSLGGNVIMNALIHADSDSEDEYAYLPRLVVGLIFLGTPFRGTKMQALPDIIARIMRPAGSHDGIIRDLAYEGPAAMDKLHSFCKLRNKLSTPTSCFSEKHKTNYGKRIGLTIGVFKNLLGGMVVEESSALIPGLTRIPLQKNHLNMNKFINTEDRSFLSISAEILKMHNNAKNIIQRRLNPSNIITDRKHALKERPEAGDCLRDLFLTDPLEDKNALKRKKGTRAPGTCEWLFGTQELTAWLGSDQTDHILWLHGNPGTGKSTVAMYLAEELPAVFSKTDGKTLAYFFCDSSFEKQKTAISIIRGLLLQLIQQHPQLLDYLLPKYNERGAELFKSFDALWTIFMAAAADQSTGRKYCIIDALDECDRDSQEVLLHQIQETFQSRDITLDIRILITSRPYPEIRQYLKGFTNKDFASFPETKKDIDRCIEEKVATLAERKEYTNKVKERVRQILADKAEGTFLWIGLACEELRDTPSKDAVQILTEIPKGLHSLYDRLIKTGLGQKGAELIDIQNILSYVAVCLRPLSLLELADACQLHQHEKDIETRERFTREHIASCRLMVVVQADKVLLLHKSVKDYIFNGRLRYSIGELEAHARFAYRCVDLLIEEFRNLDQSHISLSDYANRNWPDHARMARSKFEIKNSHADFFQIDSPCREHWLENLRSNRHFYLEIPQGFSILHVAAQWGICTLVDYVYSLNRQDHEGKESAVLVHPTRTDEHSITPLEIAVRGRYLEVISVILNRGAKVTKPALETAAAMGNKEVMELLLERGGNEIIITEKAVTTAAGNPHCGKEIMELLLERRGNEITITEEAVKAAAGNLYWGKEIMELLLERRGNEVTITEEVVEAAVWNHGKEMMELLLERRGNEITITEKLMNDIVMKLGKETMKLLLNRRGDAIITEKVVKVAVWNHGKEMMELFLERRGDAIITEEVVIATVCNDGKEMMELFLERRGDAIITEEVVIAAVCNDEKEMMELFLEQRGDAIITEGVVEAAVWNDRKEMMELFLKRQGDAIITEEVVIVAVTHSGKEMMELLLERRGDAIITEEVVKAAVWNYEKEIIELFLKRRGDAIITEKVMITAVMHSRIEMIESFLKRRGDTIITEEIVKAAAGNVYGGKEIMKLFLGERRKSTIAFITKKVLIAAAASGDIHMLNLLSRQNNLITVPAEWRCFAELYSAAKSGDADRVEQLIHEGAKLDMKNIEGQTPLWIAVAHERDAVVEVLAHRTGVNVNSVSNTGQSPLLRAAWMGYENIVTILMEAGADPHLMDKDGDTAITMARKFGHKDIVKILKRPVALRQKSSLEKD
ncbi:uncharacterized protein GGS22DRAFT_187509 [Annulohypoxylon maeteangense]|uniref:uncharacterized protein n=1 Tax=Annulohypoxylon maeteangense TaxID=1927788 RepID=UPI002008E904|nr:uncharacterized protein GGS22DRAFT_187509 [Annulohypoxylon maeteangense]KAI0886271.1 hypothetical protein GGS22DRAFT_187509 [Annulohypoxylon maeteangense]